MLGGDVGEGFRRGFWGWCEEDGKVGFCVFMKLGGWVWRLLSGCYARYENFHSWTSAGLGFLERMCLVVVLVLAAFLTRSFRLSHRQSRSSTNASHVSKYSLTLT
jgi:hypothetical protein